jgi:hypothetical protein
MFLEARLIKVNNKRDGVVAPPQILVSKTKTEKGRKRSKMRSGQLLGGVKVQPFQNAFHTSLEIDLQYLRHQLSREL